MKIVNGRKIYAADIARLEKLPADGWDRSDGRNHQWYTLYAAVMADTTVLYRLRGENSGDCYGDYRDIYAIGAARLAAAVGTDWPLSTMFSDIPEPISPLMAAVLADMGL